MQHPFHPTQTDRRTVLAAYQRAAVQGRQAPDCRIAAIKALIELYPDMAREVAAAEVARIMASDLHLVGMNQQVRRRARPSDDAR
jgi:hypothetical protein